MPDGAGRAEYESLVGPVDGPGTSRDAAAEVDQAELGADFAAFNQTLVALALDYRPITHPQAHRQAFWSYVGRRKAELLGHIRARHADRFDRLEVQHDWPA